MLFRVIRDFILARSAETYLIAAEAKIRLAKAGTGSYADALPYINAVRTRGNSLVEKTGLLTMMEEILYCRHLFNQQVFRIHFIREIHITNQIIFR
jgi:hypothetical protein